MGTRRESSWVVVLLASTCICLRSEGQESAKASSPAAPEEGQWRRKAFPLPPLWYHRETRDGRKFTMAGILYWRSATPSSSFQMVFPVYSRKVDKKLDEQCGHALLYYWRRTGSGESAGAGDLSTIRAAHRRDTSKNVLFPLFWKSRRGDSSSTVLLPLYWSSLREDAQTRIAGLFYSRKEKKNNRSRFVILPRIFSREKDDTGYSYWGVLLRLVGYEEQYFGSKKRKRLWLLFGLPIEL